VTLRRLSVSILAVLLLLTFSHRALGQSEPPVADTFSNSAHVTNNYGAQTIMMVQQGASG